MPTLTHTYAQTPSWRAPAQASLILTPVTLLPSGEEVFGEPLTYPADPDTNTVTATVEAGIYRVGRTVGTDNTITPAWSGPRFINVTGDATLTSLTAYQTIDDLRRALVVVTAAGLPEGGENGQVLGLVNGQPAWSDAPSATSLTSYATQVEALADYPTAFPAEAHGHTADAITETTTVKMMTAAERTKLAGISAGALDQTQVDARVQAIVGAAPAALDTLDELAAALGDDANFASTVTTSLAGKVPTTRTVAGKALSADVTLAKADVGLSNVDNTSDAAKPVSTAQAAALAAKAPLASPAFTGTPTGITKAHVGLGNVDNTSDAAKPVSTATQTALDVKLQFLAIGGVTVSGRIVLAPDSATYTAYGDKQTGDIVAHLAP